MKIEAYIISYNEEKMIRHTLNHYTSFCAKVFLYDNQSSDRTKDLALAYPDVEIREFDTRNFFSDREHLKIKNHVWKNSNADFAIVCDMDELLFSDHLQENLELLKAQQVTLPTVHGFNMYCEQFPHDYDIPIFDQVKTGVRATHFDKQIIFNPRRIKEINYSPGCHHCEPIGVKIRNNKIVLKLLHYKYLDKDALQRKHAQNSARLSQDNMKHGWGIEYLNKDHVEASFEILKEKSSKII